MADRFSAFCSLGGQGARLGWGAQAFQGGVCESGKEQDGQDGRDLPGGADTGLYQPPEVDDGSTGGDVDETVEALPVLASYGSHDEGR
jgi:hypothetical protein